MSYSIQVLEHGRWKTVERQKTSRDAAVVFQDYKLHFNHIRVKNGKGKIVATYNYRKT